MCAWWVYSTLYTVIMVFVACAATVFSVLWKMAEKGTNENGEKKSNVNVDDVVGTTTSSLSSGDEKEEDAVRDCLHALADEDNDNDANGHSASKAIAVLLKVFPCIDL